MSEIFGDLVYYITIILYILNIIWALYVVFYEKKTPGVIWAWLLVLFILPGIGFIIYMIFGFDGRKHARFANKAKLDETMLSKFLKKYKDEDEIKYDEENPYISNLIEMNIKGGSFPYRRNNSIKVFHEGASKFAALLDDIENAKSFIHMEYYLMHDDRLGTLIMKALAKKAKEGVEIKLLYDGMGNASNLPHFRRILIKAGGEARLFLPPRGIRINYRDHRKIAVIDGKIGYVGGLNIGDEYVSRKKRFGFWRDSHIRIEGNAVKDLELRFIMDWNFAKADGLTIDDKYFPEAQRQEADIPMQIISSGPDCKWESIHKNYFKMVADATKNVYIATPYFVPDDSLLVALKTAALSGIDVRIIIPAKPDHPMVYYASLDYMGELLDAGVKCYEYTKGFIHAKVMTMDGVITSMGTANMDIRSFRLNFEINAVIYNKEVTAEFDKQFEIDFKDCREITKELYESRSRFTRFKEAVARLISPLL